jgi:hypothetical protein
VVSEVPGLCWHCATVIDRETDELLELEAFGWFDDQ